MKKYELCTRKELEDIISSSLSYREACERIGYKTGNKYKQIIGEISNKYNINISHLGRYKENLVNSTFGKLTVINFAYIKDKQNYWECLCSCGNTEFVRTSQLKDGTKIQCRNCGYKINGMSHRKNLSGKRIGKLIVIEVDEEKTKEKRLQGESHLFWKCKCDCGNIKSYSSSHLQEGKIYSCGCLKSSGEFKVEQILKQEKINYQKEYSFSDLQGEHKPLRFDFAIFSKDKEICCLIECQGEEHTNSVKFWGGEEKFQKRIKYDSLKKQYCQDRNIPLILIPYKDYGIINKQYLYDKLREVD